MKSRIFIIAALIFTPFFAQASSPGGSDMCGLGWSVTQKKSFLGSTTRTSTNFTIPPTFGMTSGTINCDQHSLAQRDLPAAKVVVANYDVLKVEMASGSGETLAALAQTMGCSEAAVPAFGKSMQKNYEKIIGSSSLDMFENVKSQVKQEKALAQACAV